MEVSGNFANFRAVYDDMTGEVLRSHVQFLADHLANWFRTLDTTAEIALEIRELQASVDFESWKAEMETSMQLQRPLTWPKEPEKRLGMQLMLFRSVAEFGKRRRCRRLRVAFHRHRRQQFQQLGPPLYRSSLPTNGGRSAAPSRKASGEGARGGSHGAAKSQ